MNESLTNAKEKSNATILKQPMQIFYENMHFQNGMKYFLPMSRHLFLKWKETTENEAEHVLLLCIYFSVLEGRENFHSSCNLNNPQPQASPLNV